MTWSEGGGGGENALVVPNDRDGYAALDGQRERDREIEKEREIIRGPSRKGSTQLYLLYIYDDIYIYIIPGLSTQGQAWTDGGAIW